MLRILVAGGDKRALFLSEMLKNDGFEVETLGLLETEEHHTRQADVVLFPFPFAVRAASVPVLNGRFLSADEVLDRVRPGGLVIAGRGIEPYALAQERMPQCLRLRKYEQDELLKQKNADLSAEAAVFEMMQRTQKAISSLRVLITGYGLFGRALAQKLSALGGEVWVAARRGEIRQQALEDGMHAILPAEMGEAAQQMDFLLNTVPAQILDEATLRKFHRKAWLLELASAPYGFDRDVATALGLQNALLPSLPARYAPYSAAQALHETVLRWLREETK